MFYLRQSWPQGKLSPTWTLAVEEQFYIFWPFIILFIPQRYLKKLLFITLLTGVLFPFLISLFLSKNGFINILTPSCLDAFCSGGILSYIMVYSKKGLPYYFPIIKRIAVVSFILYILFKGFQFPFYVPYRTLMSFTAAGLLAAILSGKINGSLNGLLNNKVLISLGKVSYGIYLFHNFVPIYLKGFLLSIKNRNILPGFSAMMDTVNSNQSIFLLECFIVLLMVVYTSFYLYEKPIMLLKQKL